jgi:hypothetical protein
MKILFQSFFCFFLLAFLGAGFSSCGKYEEGPNFTFLSKKARITNTWKFTSQTINGIDVTPDLTLYSLTKTIKKDGTFDTEYTILSQPFTSSGSWAFSDDKKIIILIDPTGTETYEILKLTNSELKLRNTVNAEQNVTNYSAQ